jgi:hypothetical protein
MKDFVSGFCHRGRKRGNEREQGAPRGKIYWMLPCVLKPLAVSCVRGVRQGG